MGDIETVRRELERSQYALGSWDEPTQEALAALSRIEQALEELLEALEGCFYNRPGWQDKARAAIAKARGEQ